MREAAINDVQGQQVGTIREADDGTITGEGKAEELVREAPLKTFDDWKQTLHHSTYLRFMERA